MLGSGARLGRLLPVPRLHVSNLAKDFVKALQAAAQRDLHERHEQLARPCTGGHQGQLQEPQDTDTWEQRRAPSFESVPGISPGRRLPVRVTLGFNQP